MPIYESFALNKISSVFFENISYEKWQLRKLSCSLWRAPTLWEGHVLAINIEGCDLEDD
jgi:hypothetical protein